MYKLFRSIGHRIRGAAKDNTLRELARSGVAALAIKIGSAVLSFAMFVGLSRSMPIEQYGIFASGFSLATLIAVVGSFGQRSIVLRFASAYASSGRILLLRGVIRDGYRWILGGMLFASIITFIINSYSITLSVEAMAATIGLGLAMAASEYQSSVIRSQGGMTLAIAPREILWRLILILLTTLSFFHILPSASGSAWLWILMTTLAAVTWLQIALAGEVSQIRGPAAYDRNVWGTSMPGLWATSIIQAGAAPLAVILLTESLGPTASGPFFAAYRMSQILNLLLIAINLVAGPMLSRAISQEDWRSAQRICTLSSSVAGGFSLLGFLFLLLFGNTLMGVFGAGFSVGTPALLILAFGSVVNCLAGPSGVLLQMSGHDRPLFWMLMLSNGIGIVLLPFCVPIFGMLGAAILLASATSIWNVAATIYARRKLGIDPTIFALLMPPKPVR